MTTAFCILLIQKKLYLVKATPLFATCCTTIKLKKCHNLLFRLLFVFPKENFDENKMSKGLPAQSSIEPNDNLPTTPLPPLTIGPTLTPSVAVSPEFGDLVLFGDTQPSENPSPPFPFLKKKAFSNALKACSLSYCDEVNSIPIRLAASKAKYPNLCGAMKKQFGSQPGVVCWTHDKTAYVGFRGTKFGSASDLLTDAKSGLTSRPFLPDFLKAMFVLAFMTELNQFLSTALSI